MSSSVRNDDTPVLNAHASGKAESSFNCCNNCLCLTACCFPWFRKTKKRGKVPLNNTQYKTNEKAQETLLVEKTKKTKKKDTTYK